MNFLSVTCQALLALVFAIACASKVRTRASFTAFTEAVVTLGRTPRPWAVRAAAGIVALEAATAVCLAVPGLGGAGLAAAATLLAGFTYAVARALRDGASVACHCFGASGDVPPGRAQLVRNGLLLTAVAAAVPGLGAAFPSWQGWFAAWLVGAVCAVLVATADEIVALLSTVSSPSTPVARPHDVI